MIQRKYGISRAIEASTIDYLTIQLQKKGWKNISIEKTFAKIYEKELDSICVRVGDGNHSKIQLGSDATVRTTTLLVDIFASSDGLRLDLKDSIIEILKNGWVYYEYTKSKGKIICKEKAGRIRVEGEIIDTEIKPGDELTSVDPHDRFRHMLSFTITLGLIES